MKTVTKTILRKSYKKRPLTTRKYDHGLLLVIGGSEFYSGSPALASLAAFRSGVDMVRIIAPKRAADIIASFTPDLAAYPLKSDWLNKEHLAILLTMTESAKIAARGKTAVVIGGGLGHSKETQLTVLDYLSQITIPAVIDADAIYAVAKRPEIISDKPFLITPHTYEFYVLTGKALSSLSEKEKINCVQEESERLRTTILLKGPTDIISDGKEVALNKTGSPLMSKGGMGDTLAGIAGALLARGISPFEAGQAAAFINGLAGELAGKNFGEGVMATDLIEAIPKVISFDQDRVLDR